MRLKSKGFTLVEIMIVVAIIGLLAAIAIPNFVRARTQAQTNACIANLKQIDGAKQVWALDVGTPDTATPAWSDLTPNYIKRVVNCPSNTNRAYTIAAVSADPSCNENTSAHHL